MGFRVSGFGVSGYRVSGLSGLGFVGSGFWVWGFGFGAKPTLCGGWGRNRDIRDRKTHTTNKHPIHRCSSHKNPADKLTIIQQAPLPRAHKGPSCFRTRVANPACVLFSIRPPSLGIITPTLNIYGLTFRPSPVKHPHLVPTGGQSVTWGDSQEGFVI